MRMTGRIETPHIPVFARATVPPEAILLDPLRCIECGQPSRAGDRIYADTVSPSANPATLCRVCASAYRSEYRFAEGEDWEATPDE